MYLRLFGLHERQTQGNCPIAGTTWFVCNNGASNFTGCCVDSFSCDQPTCPNPDPAPLTPPASMSTTSSTSSTATPIKSTVSTTVTTTASAVFVTPSLVTVISNGQVQTVYDAASATASPTQAPQSSSSTSATPIIAGVVSGVVALSILSVLVWFCCMRRRQKKKFQESSNKYELPGGDYVLRKVDTPEANIPKDGDVFAEFGGRHKTPPPPSNRSAPRSAFSTAPLPLPQTSTHDDSMKIDTPIEYKPIPDMEKSGLTPPPMAEHPVYHVGGTTLQTPAYQPAQEMASPPMEQHPAYHISQLSQHPAFSPRTSPRSASFPRRTSEVKRQKSSPRNGGRSGPLDITPVLASLPTGRSELPAEVPASFTSSTSTTPSPPPQMRVETNYNPANYAPYDGRSRNTNSTSTYNNPTGFGVLNSPLSASQYPSPQQGSMGVVSPLSPRQQFIQQFQKQNQHLELQVEGLQVISPTQSIQNPESPFHLEKQYSHLSPSITSPRSPFSSDLRDGREKEVVSPLSPERWSGATCLNDAIPTNHELARAKAAALEQGKDEQVNNPEGTQVETPTGLTPSDDFKTWETWAQR